MWRWLTRLAGEWGGLSLGGPSTNTIRDITNTINQGGGNPADPLNSVQFHNPQNAFDGDANLRYIAGQGLLLGIDVKLVLDGNGGASEHYWKYNSTTDYSELYVDGALRAQF